MSALARILLLCASLSLLTGQAGAQERQSGWIGIALDLPTADGNAPRGETVVIAAVRPGSPADEAGLRPGDRLLSVGGLEGIDDFRDLPERLRLRVGESVTVRVERGGRSLDVTMQAAERPDDVRSRRVMLTLEPDSLVESMVRAMDSLRTRIVEARALAQRSSPAINAVRVAGDGPSPAAGIPAPFEFFVFRGEAHDSLRQAWEDLSQLAQELRREERRRLSDLRQLSGRSGGVDEADPQLRDLRTALEEVTRQSSELRTAMSEAARVTAGFDPSNAVPQPAPPPASIAEPGFSPLTPYLVGSNMVAGAQVVDLRPELARYFDVGGGVLVIDVMPGTPADIAGIIPGDVITRLDRVAVRSVEDLRFGISRSGGSLPLGLVRRGDTLEVLLSSR